MRVTQKMVQTVMDTTGVDAMTAGATLRLLAELIDPIPGDVIAVHDEDGAGQMWRRHTHDGDVWVTAGTASVATSARLVRDYGPLRYVARDPQRDRSK